MTSLNETKMIILLIRVKQRKYAGKKSNENI